MSPAKTIFQCRFTWSTTWTVISTAQPSVLFFRDTPFPVEQISGPCWPLQRDLPWLQAQLCRVGMCWVRCWAQVCVRQEAALRLCNGSCFISSSSRLMLQSPAFGFSMGKGSRSRASGKIPAPSAWWSLAVLLCCCVKMGEVDTLAIKYVFCPINVIVTWGCFDCKIHFSFLLPSPYSSVSLRVKRPGGTCHCPAKFILDNCFTSNSGLLQLLEEKPGYAWALCTKQEIWGHGRFSGSLC